MTSNPPSSTAEEAGLVRVNHDRNSDLNNNRKTWQYEPTTAETEWVEHLSKGFAGDFIKVLSAYKAVQDPDSVLNGDDYKVRSVTCGLIIIRMLQLLANHSLRNV